MYNLAELIKGMKEKNEIITEKKPKLESMLKKEILLTIQDEICRQGLD